MGGTSRRIAKLHPSGTFVTKTPETPSTQGASSDTETNRLAVDLSTVGQAGDGPRRDDQGLQRAFRNLIAYVR